jgi:hypothetical protein
LQHNSNSLLQLAAIQSSISFIEQAIGVLYIVPSSFPIIIADFGSSHGANSIYAIKTIIDYIKLILKKLKIHFQLSITIYQTNDRTTLFDILNQDKTYFGLSNGDRSFYEQCLPSNSLTIAYFLT